LLQDFLGDVNHLQSRSGDALKAFVGGEITDLHQVMVAGQEAEIALDLMIEIRNRVMESFQEIMRIQV
jgi:flagellar hook-basal body complex protein FliE